MTEEEMEDATKDLSFDGSPGKILVSSQQIITKAIEKAIAGGWFDVAGLNGFTVWSPVSVFDTLIILEERESYEKRQYNYQAIIFNHDFAKALWGEVPNTGYLKAANLIPWKYHLQQMIIADDPIAYLGENI